MNRILLITTILLLQLHSATNISVTIEPQKRVVEAIGGDLVNVNVMVKAGNDPHTYEPKPSQMIQISKSDIYFAIGLDFEDIWLPKFQHQNNQMLISDLSFGVKKIKSQECHSDHHSHDHAHEAPDPHIWTSPQNVKIMALNTFATLSMKDSQNKKIYEKNLNKFLKTLDKTDNTIRKLLNKKYNFMVFHPSWSYFAKEYNLQQIAIEIDGKDPTPKELIYIINQAKEANIKTIFIQPEFPSKSANIIAKELNIPIVPISNLTYNISNTLIDLARHIASENK